MVEKKSRSAKVVGVAKKAVASVKAVVKNIPAKSEKKSAAVKPEVNEDFWRRVASKAYEIYVNRGGVHGDDQKDWYEAERLVRAELGL